VTARNLDILVVGGGSFGTAVASILSQADRRVALWVRRDDLAREVNHAHTNSRYLPGVALPPLLRATTDLQGSVASAPVILLAVPSATFRQTARALGEHARGDQVLVHGTKGIELGTYKRMSEVLFEETCVLKVGVVSGPNLAKELVRGSPAGCVVASRYDEVVESIQRLFQGSTLRTYGVRDVVGTEIGGSFKNIIALAAGVVDGLGMGDNARSLLVTRGLGEMARWGVAQGADALTFGGLAGIGDLVATCSSPLSRNHQFGTRLARGERPEEIKATMVEVAEGVTTTKAVHEQAQGQGVDLPIVRTVHRMLYQGLPVLEARDELLAVPVGREFPRGSPRRGDA
jgi:glycerol-3-phosphate dehydrogenase (NAD(P)+)